MVRPFCIGALGALTLLCAACSSESAAQPDVGPTGDPAISFAEPSSAREQPLCVAVGTEADARVPLLVDVVELVLRPPGACGYYVQCGHLDLYVDDVLNDESAVPAIDLLLRKLADRYHDGGLRADTDQPDVLHVRVVAANDADETFSDHAGKPLEDSLELATAPTCPR